MKRALDVTVAVSLLILSAPLMIAIALAIRLSSPGPIIYRGQRVGLHGQPFQILKFRSMRQHSASGRGITTAGDPRITAIGRLLRLTKLDELPQFINVLRGEMSLVGPRPEAPEYVALYTPEQRAVLSVPPGITGPSQIQFRHEEALLDCADPERYYVTDVMPAKLSIDLKYVAYHSLWVDFTILARSLGAIILQRRTRMMPTEEA